MKKNISKTAQEMLGEKQDHPTRSLPTSSAQIRIPTQRPAAQLDHHIKHETHQVTKEWTAEATHTEQALYHLVSSYEAAPDLSPKRIQRLHLKKNLLKKMAELHAAAGKRVDRKVNIVDQTNTQQKLEQNQDELWRDMIKPHEERQFQIGRITNFYS
jgi:exonuclease VII large subunit